MDKLLVKYWKGWMNPENMKNPEWLTLWQQEAEKAEAEEMELVVFKLPKNLKDSHSLIREIETLLQERLGK